MFNNKLEKNSCMGSIGYLVCRCLRGKGQVKDMCIQMCLEVVPEMAEGKDSGRFFKRDGAHKWKALSPVLVLMLVADRLIPLFNLSERDGTDGASMEWR